MEEIRYRIWIRNSDATHKRTTRSDYGNLLPQDAQRVCNKLNSHNRKQYPDLHEAGMEFISVPEGMVPGPQYVVYNNTGHVILRTQDKEEAIKLAQSHDDYTWHVNM